MLFPGDQFNALEDVLPGYGNAVKQLLDEIGPGTIRLLSPGNTVVIKEIKGGKRRRGGGPLVNKNRVVFTASIGLLYLCLMCKSLWIFGNKDFEVTSELDLPVTSEPDLPLLKYVYTTMVTIIGSFFVTAQMSQYNLYHTVASKVFAYVLALQKAYYDNKTIKPEDLFSLAGVYPLIQGFFQGKKKEEIKNDVTQSVDKSNETGALIQSMKKPRVTLLNNELVVNECPTTFKISGGRRRKTRRV